MKQIPGMPSTIMRTIEDEIDILLYNDTDGKDRFNPHSLTPLKELHFRNGIGKLPSASKEPKELKSVLEAGMYVSEVPIMKMKGGIVEPTGVYANQQDKVRVYIPGTDKPYYLNMNRLKYVLSRYVIGGFSDVQDGWEVRYVWLAMDRDTLLKFCDGK
jgi:hypothetical protein